jgi:hypothetical protein
MQRKVFAHFGPGFPLLAPSDDQVRPLETLFTRLKDSTRVDRN